MALQAHVASGSQNWESAAEAVAIQYAKRLATESGYGYVVAPVRRQIHHQPVYYLVFLTKDPHGLWVFGAAGAKAREKWIEFLGPDPNEQEGMLFDTVAHQLGSEHATAITQITDNLRKLTADGKPKTVVRHVTEVYAGVFGEAKETAFTAAVRALLRSGEIEYVTKGKPHQYVLRKLPS